MTDESLQHEVKKVAKALLIYLVIQGTMLITTFLDAPIYDQINRARGYMDTGLWLVLWFVLLFFGLTTGLFILVSRTWRRAWKEAERVKLACGYLLGGIAGLLTLSLRELPIISPSFFYLITGLLVVLVVIYTLWERRQARGEEIFP